METNLPKAKLAVGIALVGAIMAFPLVVSSNYWLNLANMAISLSVVCLGLNILLGYTGQICLAQAAFWGIGAYASALLTTKLGCPVWIGMLSSFLVAGLFGVLLGIPSLKLSGHYLAVVTIGFGFIVQLLLTNWISLTNGADGITQIPSPAIGSFAFDTPARFFYLAAGALVLLTLACIHLKNSRVGRALLAIRQNEMAAETSRHSYHLFQDHGLCPLFGLCGLRGKPLRPQRRPLHQPGHIFLRSVRNASGHGGARRRRVGGGGPSWAHRFFVYCPNCCDSSRTPT